MFEFIQLTLILLALLAALVYIYLIIHFNYWKKRGVIGPKPKPLLGNFPSTILQSRNFVYDMDDIYRQYKGKERFVGVFMARNPQILLIDPSLVRHILISNFKVFHDNELSILVNKKSEPILGRNPFFMRGVEWKDKRTEITQALTINRIKAMYPVMQICCEKMTKYLTNVTKNQPKNGIDTKELASRFTTEVVMNCIYGIEAGAFDMENCPVLEAGISAIKGVSRFFTNAFIVSIFPALKNLILGRVLTESAQKFYTDIQTDAVKFRMENKCDRKDLLNYLLELKEKKNLTELDLTAHMMTFFFDGFETSSLVITHFLYMMGKHKQVQEKLRMEINESLSSDSTISFEKLSEMPYLDQCINESLRLFSPAMFLNKLCTETCELLTAKEKKVQLEKGIAILIPIYSIHHDEEYYPNPFEFNPDRMTPENLKKFKDLGVFLPFGDGPRICLGMKFGLTQTKSAAAELVRNWEITVNDNTRKDYAMDKNNFLMMMEGGIWLNFQRLNK